MDNGYSALQGLPMRVQGGSCSALGECALGILRSEVAYFKEAMALGRESQW